jgi:hypothetical protein
MFAVLSREKIQVDRFTRRRKRATEMQFALISTRSASRQKKNPSTGSPKGLNRNQVEAMGVEPMTSALQKSPKWRQAFSLSQ